MNDTLVAKVQSIQRCVQRARQVYLENKADFLDNYNAQDAAVLNIVRACELAIDLANILIKTKKLGIPTCSADSFNLLAAGKVIDSSLAAKLKKMVALRNISVHEYQNLNYQIVVAVIENEIADLLAFTDIVIDVRST